MHFLDQAPRSPQQGKKTKPNHFYNYAKRNSQSSMANPYSANPMQFQQQQPQRVRPNPYQTNQLAEDHTIEHINESSGNGGKNKLLNILLIGFLVVILFGGLGIGGYFLYKSNSKATTNKKAATNNGTSSESSSDESEFTESGSGDGEESDEESGEEEGEQVAASATTTGQSDTVFVHQLYFQNKHISNDILAYIANEAFMYTKLENLEGIAGFLGHKYGWKTEKLNGDLDNHLHDGMCGYLPTKLIQLDAMEISSSVDLCDGKYKLFQHASNPLDFMTVSAHFQQHGATLSMYSMVYSIGNDRAKLYVDSNTALQTLAQPQPPQTGSNSRRRRLSAIPSRLPRMSQIATDTQSRIQLPAGYRGTSIQALKQAMHSQTIYTQSDNAIHLKLGNYPYGAYVPGTTQLNYKLTVDHKPNMYSPPNSRGVYEHHLYLKAADEYYREMHGGSVAAKWATAQELAACVENGKTLSQLAFIEFRFVVKVESQREPAVEWDCDFNQDRDKEAHDEIVYNREWLSKIAEDKQRTICRHSGEQKTLCEIVDAIDAKQFEQVIGSRRLSADECQCHDACGHRWESLDDGNRLILKDCGIDGVSINKIEWKLKIPSQAASDAKHLQFHSIQHPYKQTEDEIVGTDVPFPRCLLRTLDSLRLAAVVDDKQSNVPKAPVGQGQGRFAGQPGSPLPVSDGGNSEPRAARAADTADSTRAKRGDRRNILAEYEDASGAENKQNMYMIMGCTIFCVLIGIQSFYWLSNSY